MNFIKHSNLSGHAPFSPSQPAWLRYDDDKAIKYLIAKKASERGTRLHAWAKETIDMKIKQPRSKKTLYSYVMMQLVFEWILRLFYIIRQTFGELQILSVSEIMF